MHIYQNEEAYTKFCLKQKTLQTTPTKNWSMWTTTANIKRALIKIFICEWGFWLPICFFFFLLSLFFILSLFRWKYSQFVYEFKVRWQQCEAKNLKKKKMCICIWYSSCQTPNAEYRKKQKIMRVINRHLFAHTHYTKLFHNNYSVFLFFLHLFIYYF